MKSRLLEDLSSTRVALERKSGEELDANDSDVYENPLKMIFDEDS